MLRGEIWWAAVPMKGSDGKPRPMLIVSDDVFNGNPRYPKVMAVHLTSVVRLEGPYRWEVRFPKGTAGLKKSSIAKCGEVYTLRKPQLQKPGGTVPAPLMRQVDEALSIALGLHSRLRAR